MPSRRTVIEMTDEEIRHYLATEKTLIIVSNGRNGYPHPMPMWFNRDQDGALYCTTFGKSQKVLNWRRDPKATLLVESGEEYAELKGVMIFATCEIIDDHDEVIDTLVAINACRPGTRRCGPRRTARFGHALGSETRAVKVHPRAVC